jgi:hypothetical protein
VGYLRRRAATARLGTRRVEVTCSPVAEETKPPRSSASSTAARCHPTRQSTPGHDTVALLTCRSGGGGKLDGEIKRRRKVEGWAYSKGA